MNILIINGPNLNLLGKREPAIYGNMDFETYLQQLKVLFPNVTIAYFQSNHEGDIIDKLHTEGFSADGIVINAGAYTHTSVGIADAIKGINSPVIEVHISNVFAREEFRHHSYLSPVCVGCICGFGMQSYELAVRAIISRNK
jgi:3-dehydroquinate dehydratase-2